MPYPRFDIRLYMTCLDMLFSRLHTTLPKRSNAMKKEILLVGLALALGGTVAPAWALFETDRALSEKATVSMIDALKTAEQARPGKPVEVNMGKDDGRVVYKIEIIDGKNTHKVYVDAMTGKVHEIK
jgi:uncharacterized membrane protein YkoI